MKPRIRSTALFIAAATAGIAILHFWLKAEDARQGDEHRWWPASLGMCLVVAGILGYLGTHVLARKVIFVDLATAQLAALGAAYAIWLDYEPEHEENQVAIYLFSLAFALVGAAVIALTRMKKERVPHEAFIGIIYASASAMAMLVLAKSKGEGTQIKAMLVGSLLTVASKKVTVTAVICAAVGLFHFIFREKFHLISTDPEEAEKRGISVRLWDFFFYLSFGVVITSCVSAAGVLLVFSYLVVPAVIAVMFVDSTRLRIAVAWGVGALVSIGGLILSNEGNFPTGPSVVAASTVALILAGTLHYITKSERSGVAALRLLGMAGALALAFWGSTFLRKTEEHAEHHEDEFTRLVKVLKESEDDKSRTHVIELVRNPKSSDLVLEHAAKALAALEAVEAVPALKEAAGRDIDSGLQVVIARAILDLKDPGGFPILIQVIEKGDANEPRMDAKGMVEERSAQKVDMKALDPLKKWWSERGPALKWRSETKRFE